jgi:probable rRNA maturation factor
MTQRNHKIAIQIACQSPCEDIELTQLKRLVRFVCKRFNVTSAAVQISLVDDAAIKVLHKRFFNTAKTTDVISFDLSDATTKQNLFDIIINTDQARRQAAKRGHSVAAETALYLVHGLLHQLGFDDTSDTKAKRMHREEDAIL